MQPTIPTWGDDFEVVRDPLWNTIRLDPTALRIIDTAGFQRLRHIRQLGHAFLVYPGATHTRFDHALGVYHLARRALHLLGERGELAGVEPVDCRLIPYAALLHDIGHYPFSHALEELGPQHLSEHHERLTGRFLEEPELAAILEGIAPDAAERVERLVRGQDSSPLQGLIAGDLDLDKIEYLNRDAKFCGVPYGTVDVDRLIHALALLRDPSSGKSEIGIHEKGVSALESLLFAKYQMFRNVYWHHAVRSATALFKRTIQDAVEAGILSSDELVGLTDEALLSLLEVRSRAVRSATDQRLSEQWIPSLRNRRLPKRALEIPGDVLRDSPLATWYYEKPRLRAAIEDRIASELELPGGSVLLDYPEKPRMMGLDLLLLQRSGEVRRLPESGYAGLIDLPRIADQLYHSARVFRVFTLERRSIEPGRFLELLNRSAEELEEGVRSNQPLL